MRRIGYGVMGTLIGVIIYITLLTTMPSSVNSKSTLLDFEEQNLDNYISQEDYYKGGSIVPFLENGSYHVSIGELLEYERKGVVKYGKLNPMFYYEKEVIAEPKEEEDIDKENPNDGIVVNGKGDNGKWADVQMGFNIHDRREEAMDISHIKKSFNLYARLPVDKEYYNISSGFGARIDPFEQVKAYHVGLDIASANINRKNVYSVIHGEVVDVGLDEAGYGNYIIVKHDGFETLYGHLDSKPLFDIGDKVFSGDVLGYVGNTGRSTGPHLHFEVGINGVKFNPQIFIDEIRKVD